MVLLLRFLPALLGARGLLHDGNHRVPALGAIQGAVDVARLRPAHVERRVAGAGHAGDLHRHRLLADARERIVHAGVVV
ncbi:hypothetical protein G6F23_015567 [Rhizopus arrhizus]|nr:hypothetical protein G6F23_015567 [Rhizopus arrhizus]